MRKLILPLIVIALGFSFINSSCKNNDHQKEELIVKDSSHVAPIENNEVYFDSTLVAPFFFKHPQLKPYQSSVEALYKKHQYHYVWFDKKGIHEVGGLLYKKINTITSEGIQTTVPYKSQLKQIVRANDGIQKPTVETELLLSSLYFFYADKVYHGLDIEKSTELGWYLPRNKQSYVNHLDSLLVDPSLINKDKKEMSDQYYRLKEVLKQYRKIEKKGGWSKIELDTNFNSFKPGDSSATIAQIRHYLYQTKAIAADSKSALYDDDLKKGVLQFKKENGNILSTTISNKHIALMNIPIADRIKTIIVNMERSRWIPSDVTKSKESIVVNIPSFQLTYFKENKPELISNVVVGKKINQTVIFSGMLRYIVFSPYWNVPTSITEKEIKPSIAKNKNYLSEHNMEWNNGRVRQKPGPKNSLGLVKFLFPNNNNIYLHDTPSKSLFNEEKRAFSHGCIRVAKPKELANIIMK